jgi:hypothetical protein
MDGLSGGGTWQAGQFPFGRHEAGKVASARPLPRCGRRKFATEALTRLFQARGKKQELKQQIAKLCLVYIDHMHRGQHDAAQAAVDVFFGRAKPLSMQNASAGVFTWIACQCRLSTSTVDLLRMSFILKSKW